MTTKPSRTINISYRLIFTCISIVLVNGVMAETPVELMSQALYAEESEGNIDKAIQLYQEILEQDIRNRPLTAQACYRMAMCHSKKGNDKKAYAVLNQLLESYPEQTAMVQKAQTELNRMLQKPLVIATFPLAYANDIPMTQTIISVSFNRPMATDRWSWTGHEHGLYFPEVTGEPYYDNSEYNCHLPVKLEPGKIYWVGINSEHHDNFRSRINGTPAAKYVILFATADEKGNPTEIPEEMLREAEKYNYVLPGNN